MLVLERVGVLVRRRHLVARSERLVALNDVEAARFRIVVGSHGLAVEIEDELLEIGLVREQTQPLEETLLGEAPFLGDVLEDGFGEVRLELLARDERVRHVLERFELADWRDLGVDGIDLLGQSRIQGRSRRLGSVRAVG